MKTEITASLSAKFLLANCVKYCQWQMGIILLYCKREHATVSCLEPCIQAEYKSKNPSVATNQIER